MSTTELLKIRDVAQVLGLSYESVRRRIADGEIDVIRVGSGPKAPIRIAYTDLADYLRRVQR